MTSKTKKKSLFFFFLFLIFLTPGCSSISYTLQIVSGHFEVLSQSHPIDELIKKTETSKMLKQQLLLAKQARGFATRNLKLPENSSYTRYTDLKRKSVIWNVVVAREFSLELQNWCFPIAGCVSYKGFYSKKDAEQFAQKKELENGVEASIMAVPAYSTLGWSNWFGGDPLLNTFIYGSKTSVVGLIFHELAHQKIYVKDDSAFNEAFATAVERDGVNEWLKTYNKPSDVFKYQIELKRRSYFNDLFLKARSDLKVLYSTKISFDEMRISKSEIMINLRQNLLSSTHINQLDEIKKNKYVSWVYSINNPYLGMVGLYEDLTPGFRALFVKSDSSWEEFYKEVKKLSKKPKIERRNILLKYATE